MEDWKECTIGEITNVQTGPFGSQLHEKDYVKEGTPIVTVEHLGNRKFKTQNLPLVSDSDKKRLSKYILTKGDLVFSRVGSVDRCTYTAEENDGWMFSGRCLRVRPYENIDALFLYYYFNLDFTKQFIRNIAVGATMPSINTALMCEVPVKLPPLPTQQKIAQILSSLDDKIELNNKINANLEQQAQALFKSWFVDFEPFGGEMPAGWKVGKLSEILKLKKNTIQPGEDTSLPYLPIDLIPIKSLAIKESRPNEEALSSLLRFEENDILIGAMRVYFHRVAIAPFDGITRTTCFVLEPQNPNYFAYGVITCNQDLTIDYAQKTSKGSTMPYAVWEGGLGEYEIPIPDEETAMKFNDIVKPLLEQIKKSYFENKNLQELRDTLLPKLMSGELEVN